MKNLLKLIMLALMAAPLFFVSTVKAQTVPVNTFRFDVGLESGLTTGDINYYSYFNIGATARLQYGVSKKVALTLTSGYYDFLGKAYRGSMGMVPVKAGFKAFISSGFYFSGEAGVGIETQKYGGYYDIGNGLPPSTKLILSPGLGYATKSLDFGLRFESFSGQKINYGLVGLRVAYGLGL